ncbi:bifunctional 4-hydroxy-2-oxoglutarate aldolase/2-dehydro-3-deoxy-phosphogluconate aldolase [Paenibacillus sp. NPDC057967]|uniref:bifunctional 4-hydroxy-2-oxoglutarate aldolase/2-dehydro-3-deoxy-phosphogluconate aldolase n=1 Tax=Paenibacillus sp. NPDC057967 TaxID=3346293 RepID=UPI0036D9C11E
MNLTEQLKQQKIVAILRGVAPERVLPVAEALSLGGIRFMEITMNSEQAVQSIAMLRERLPQLHIGAGTVTNVQLAREAAAAGAEFLISANVDTAMICYGVEQGLHVWPGAMTPTEIVLAWEAGAQAVKLFPATVLGIDYLKSVRAPLDQIPLIATGGIEPGNAAAYIQAGACALGVGGQLINHQWIQAGKYAEITDIANQYLAAVKGESI